MSKILLGVFGALAVSLTFGAVQLASGRDLAGWRAAATEPSTAVNRAAKADRAGAPRAAAKTETIALRVDRLSDTSVLIRLPAAREEARRRPVPPPQQGGKPESRRTIACEPVVSILTEIAKNLQPGRCIT